MAFDVYRHLTEHQVVHRQDKPFTCKICNKSYSRATVLSQHMRSHGSLGNETTTQMVTITSSEPTQTPIASMTTTTVSVPAIAQPVYKCQQCEKLFMTPSELKDHESVHNPQPREEKKVIGVKEVIVMVKPEEPQVIQLMPQFKCYSCDEHFNTELERTNHALTHNRVVTNDVPQQVHVTPITSVPNITSVTTIEPPSLLVPALDLEMEADNEISYDDVIKLTLLDNKGPCNVCGKSHLKSQPCEKFKCDVCDKRFSFLSNFNVHKRIHKREKPFRCSVCGKSFRLAKSLTVHMVLHTETSFDCPVCDRIFNRSGSLKVHMRSHTTAELQGPKRSYIDVDLVDDDLFGDDDENNREGIMLDFMDDNPTYCDICGRQFTICNANTRTHKCSKYPIDEDLEDEEDQLDIWNCE